MRTHKYRYWYSGKMLEVGSIEFFENGTYRVNDELVGGVLLQSTNLLDKNGKEIYEGDILDPGTYRVIPWTVVWVDKWAKYALLGKSRYAAQSVGEKRNKQIFNSIQRAPRMEVIGNVWETPELLK